MDLVEQNSHNSRHNLCQRYKNLQLLTYIERPWKAIPELSEWVEIATTNRESIDSSCTLCMQFAAFLQEFIGDDLLTMYSNHVFSKTLDCVMSQFSMTFLPSNRSLLLLPTKPLVFRSRDQKSLPFQYREPWPDDICTDVLPDQPPLSNSPDYERLKAWIWQCCTEHKETCGITEGHRLRPSRVIDCETQELCTNDEDYVCLSYVWGPAPVGAEGLGKSLPRNLPQTIRDALTVTLNIGQRYLWVDRYCIDQNDASEKHNSIRNMNAIYEGAVITIIAAAGADANHGLPCVTRSRKLTPTLTVGNHSFEAVCHPSNELVASQWNTRGWTYQEFVLSRRTISFTDTQVYLRCLSDRFSEYEDRTGSRWYRERAFSIIGVDSTPQMIYPYLSTYWHKRLSYETDILNGFSGIFQAFSRLWNSHSAQSVHHFYGIPILHNRHSGPCISGFQADESKSNTMCQATASFALDLAWKVFGKTAIKPNGLFPSWTWASIKPCRSDLGQHGYLKFYHDIPDYEPPIQVIRHLDTRVQICLRHVDGVESDLTAFDEHHEDYTSFRPLLDITTYVVHVSTRELSHVSRPQLIGISAFPHAHIWWQEEPLPIGEKLLALYVGSIDRDYRGHRLVFILVQEDGAEQYRRVGVLNTPFNIEKMEKWYRRPSRNYATFLQDIIDGPEWEQQTLRLV